MYNNKKVTFVGFRPKQKLWENKKFGTFVEVQNLHELRSLKIGTTEQLFKRNISTNKEIALLKLIILQKKLTFWICIFAIDPIGYAL